MARQIDTADFGAAAPRRGESFLIRALRAVRQGLRNWAEKREDRAAFLNLQALDERQLRDIGLTRNDVETAARLPVWQSASEEAQRIARSRRKGASLR